MIQVMEMRLGVASFGGTSLFDFLDQTVLPEGDRRWVVWQDELIYRQLYLRIEETV